MNFIGLPIAKLAAVPMQKLGDWLTIPQNLSDQIDSGEQWVFQVIQMIVR